MVTESAAHEIEQRPEPVSRPKILADGVMGMLLFVFAEIMMFAGLISAHRIVRSQVAGEMWPPYGQPRLPVQETAVNTAALLVSGIVLVFAHLAFKKEASRARLPILIALLLGLVFVVSQGAEWVALLGEGLTIQSSTYGGFFYLIVGAHGLHAIAAILALAATNNNDRVGLLLVTDRVELFVPPDSGRRHALRLVLDILSFRPAGRGTKLSQALEYAARGLHRRTAVFLISDFMMDDESDPVFVHDARRFSREHDLVPIRLSDPGTATLPDVGLLSLADPETGLRHIVNTGDERVRRQYAERRAAKRSAMDTLFRELRLDVIEVSSAADYVLPLIVFFRRRERVTR